MELVNLENEVDPSDYHKQVRKLKEAIDYDCAKKNMNLAENGDKSLLYIEAIFLFASANSKCIKIDPIEFSELFLDLSVAKDERSEDYVACAKYELQNLEPTSKLAKISSIDEVHKNNCSHFDISLHTYNAPLLLYRERVYLKLNETTCGVVTQEFIDVITYKTILLASEKDEELRNSEISELFTTVTGKLHKLADCILERIQ